MDSKKFLKLKKKMENLTSERIPGKHCRCAYVLTDTGAHTCGHTSMVSSTGELDLSTGTEGQKGSWRRPVCFRPCSQHRGREAGAAER